MSDNPRDPGDAPTPVRAMREVAREREKQAWELRIRNWSIPAIGRELGVTAEGARKILKRIEARTLRELTASVGLIKARQTCQLEHLITEAYTAWEKSKKPGKKKRITTSAHGSATTKETAARDGDPRFLAEIRALLAAQRDIWRIGRGENDNENDDGSYSFDAMLNERRTAALAALSEPDRRRRLEYAAAAARQEAARIEALLAAPPPPPDPAEGA